MSGQKWTRGPWFWSQGVDDWELVGAGANRVLFCWSDRTKWKCGLIVGENIKEADARLIAAAPDMAEALKFVSQFLAEGSNDPAERARAIAMIDGALIKAGA